MRRDLLSLLVWMAIVVVPSHPADRAQPRGQTRDTDAAFTEAIRAHDAVRISELLSKEQPKRMDILLDQTVEADDVAIVKILFATWGRS
jgi:hypothetical protein